MSKQILESAFESVTTNNYSWSIYLFTINRKRKNAYVVHNFKFRNQTAKDKFCVDLVKSVKKYQVEPLDSVQLYDGTNPKIVCDKIDIVNPLLANEFSNFMDAIIHSIDEKVGKKANGYIVFGTPINAHTNLKKITMIKVANPLIKLSDEKATVLTANTQDEWDFFESDACKFYWTTDIVLIDNVLYNFNLKFESLFDLEKTLQQNKTNVISEISAYEFFANNPVFVDSITKYKNPRTFIAYNKDKILILNDVTVKNKVALSLNIAIKADGSFDFQTEKQALDMLKFLCDKKAKEIHTDECIDVNGIVK